MSSDDRTLFSTVCLEDSRRQNNPNWQNELLDMIMFEADRYRNCVGGDRESAARMAQFARLLLIIPNPPNQSHFPGEWVFTKENGDEWNFRLDRPDDDEGIDGDGEDHG
jgi:hypothetical protein